MVACSGHSCSLNDGKRNSGMQSCEINGHRFMYVPDVYEVEKEAAIFLTLLLLKNSTYPVIQVG